MNHTNTRQTTWNEPLTATGTFWKELKLFSVVILSQLGLGAITDCTLLCALERKIQTKSPVGLTGIQYTVAHTHGQTWWNATSRHHCRISQLCKCESVWLCYLGSHNDPLAFRCGNGVSGHRSVGLPRYFLYILHPTSYISVIGDTFT